MFNRKNRFFAAGIHFLCSLGVVSVAAYLIFQVWLPSPFDQIASGNELFFIVFAVDLVLGPFLTLILWTPIKPKYQLQIDMVLIVFLQVSALTYGLREIYSSRPVLMVFEIDRLRVVYANDVDEQKLQLAPKEYRTLSAKGPILAAVQKLSNDDPKFLESVQKSLNGIHLAFRPEHWVTYDSQKEQILQKLRPVTDLYKRYPDRMTELKKNVDAIGVPEVELGYLPLVSGDTTDWVGIVTRYDARPTIYFQIDGW